MVRGHPGYKAGWALLWTMGNEVGEGHAPATRWMVVHEGQSVAVSSVLNTFGRLQISLARRLDVYFILATDPAAVTAS